MLYLTYVAHSEIGLVRKNNQDSGYASPTMLLVADGMGGAAAGDLASAVAVTDLHAADDAWDGKGGMLALMEQAVASANQHIADLVVDDHSLDGMGTTVCGGLFDGERLGIAHIGDSRGYLVRDGELSRLTTDHSWVQSLVDEGKISEEEALHHPHRSLLLKVLNGHPSNTPDLFHVRLQDGDRVMFCSDGLCGLVEDAEIAAGLAIADREQALDTLVAAAHAAGGLDNITIVLADVSATAPEQAPAPLVLGAATSVTIPSVARPTFVADPVESAAAVDTLTGPVDADGNPVPIAPAPSPVTPEEAAAVIDPGPVEDPEDARYRPRPRPRRRWLFTIAIPLLTLALIGGLATIAAQQYLASRWFVGVSGTKVAVYRGAPGKIGPFDMATLKEVSDVDVTNLPPRFAEDVRGNVYRSDSLDGARVTVDSLRKRAEGCVATRRERANATVAPVPPSPSATPDPSASPTPGATVTPSRTPTPTAPPPPEEC